MVVAYITENKLDGMVLFGFLTLLTMNLNVEPAKIRPFENDKEALSFPADVEHETDMTDVEIEHEGEALMPISGGKTIVIVSPVIISMLVPTLTV